MISHKILENIRKFIVQKVVMIVVIVIVVLYYSISSGDNREGRLTVWLSRRERVPGSTGPDVASKEKKLKN